MHVTVIWGVVSSNSSYLSCLFFFTFFMSSSLDLCLHSWKVNLPPILIQRFRFSCVNCIIFSNVKSQNLHYLSVFFFPSYFNSVLLFSENNLLFICFLLCIFCLFSVILTFPPRRLQIALPWGVISYFLSDGLATDTQIWSNCVNIYQLGTIGEGIWHYSILLTC